MLRIESPPSSKKSSSTPTSATPRTLLQIAASSVSRGECAAVRCRGGAAGAAGSGSAARSTFPVGVSGRVGSGTYAPGTMYSGSSAPRCRRSSGASSSGAPAQTT